MNRINFPVLFALLTILIFGCNQRYSENDDCSAIDYIEIVEGSYSYVAATTAEANDFHLTLTVPSSADEPITLTYEKSATQTIEVLLETTAVHYDRQAN